MTHTVLCNTWNEVNYINRYGEDAMAHSSKIIQLHIDHAPFTILNKDWIGGGGGPCIT